MTQQHQQLPPMPPIGHPESFYAQQIQLAEKRADVHAREAYKVGQYITLALDRTLSWEDKLKYFSHALRRHCLPPPLPDEEIWMFYRKLANLIRDHIGAEALRLAGQEDDVYAAQLEMGHSAEEIAEDAETFFARLMGPGNRKLDHFNEEDWAQLKLLRDQWV